jgi:hypothetical protein
MERPGEEDPQGAEDGERAFQGASEADLSEHPPAAPECAAVRQWLRDQADGDLDDDLERRVAEHVHRCVECDRALSRAEFESIRLRAALQRRDRPRHERPNLQPSADFTVRVMQRVRDAVASGDDSLLAEKGRSGSVRVEWPRRRIGWRLLVAPVALLVVLAALLVQWPGLRESGGWRVQHATDATWTQAGLDGHARLLASGQLLASRTTVQTGALGSATLHGPRELRRREAEELVLYAETTVVADERPLLLRGQVEWSAAAGAALELGTALHVVSDGCRVRCWARETRRFDAELTRWPLTAVNIEVLAGAVVVRRGLPAQDLRVEAGHVAHVQPWAPVHVDRIPDSDWLQRSRMGPPRFAVGTPAPVVGERTIGGTVLAQGEGGIAGATITLTSARGAQSVVTGADGHFTLRGFAELEGNLAVVTVSPPAARADLGALGPLPVRVANAPAGQSEVRLGPFELRAGREVNGRVLDAEQRALAGALVVPGVVDELAGRVELLRHLASRSDREGWYRVQGLPAAQTPCTHLVLVAESERRLAVATLPPGVDGAGLASAQQDLRFPASRDLQLTGLPREQRIQVLESISGLPVGTLQRAHEVHSDAAGTAMLTGIGPGPVWIASNNGVADATTQQPLSPRLQSRLRAARPLPESDSLWIASGSRYEKLHAPGGERRRFVSAVDARLPHARGGIRLFLWLASKEEIVFAGEFDGTSAVPIELPDPTEAWLFGVGDDGSLGVVALSESAGEVQVPIGAPGSVRLDVALQAKVLQAGRIAVLRLEALEGPLAGQVFVRVAELATDWSVTGLLPGNYRVTIEELPGFETTARVQPGAQASLR